MAYSDHSQIGITMTEIITLRADELKPSHNIYRDGYIYTVAETIPEGEDYLLVRVISPRRVEDIGEPVVPVYRWHRARPITVYK